MSFRKAADRRPTQIGKLSRGAEALTALTALYPRTVAAAYARATMAELGTPFVVVEASPAAPRHDSAGIVELSDGRLLMAWTGHTGGEMIGHDHAPCDIAAMTSADGGLTWGERRTLVSNDPGDVNIHFPSFLRLPDDTILFYI